MAIGRVSGNTNFIKQLRSVTESMSRYAIILQVPQSGTQLNTAYSALSAWNAGYPLRSVDLMLDYVRGTTTKTGLEVTALLNQKNYEKGIKVSKAQFKEIGLLRNAVLPNWNYTISPKPGN